MRSILSGHTVLLLVVLLAVTATGQVEGIRQSTGMPLSGERLVYGRVTLEGVDPNTKPPEVTVTLVSQRIHSTRTTLDSDGYFYFRELPASGGTIVVEVNGSEAARQTLLTVGPRQQRFDFVVTVTTTSVSAKPGTVDAKYAYERSKSNRDLFFKAVQFIETDTPAKAIPLLKKVVAADAGDYAAWTILGAAYSAVSDPQNAERAFLSGLSARPDSVPTMISLGKHYLVQKKLDPAIEILLRATIADPKEAMAFRLLGDAYLRARQGSKGVPALEEAIRLQPVEMAECHLLLAKLYDVAGAKHLASRQFQLFLSKVPDHPEKEKMAAYIRENPVENDTLNLR
ncbi:MAG TPA: tetratricopeptide repeat protein [Pyrinomonadaceae bacterium]|nr:tetratricopeptide repeat protein [Pyrinomonadaceae bacterium]